jgi:hypothetical protein
MMVQSLLAIVEAEKHAYYNRMAVNLPAWNAETDKKVEAERQKGEAKLEAVRAQMEAKVEAVRAQMEAKVEALQAQVLLLSIQLATASASGRIATPVDLCSTNDVRAVARRPPVLTTMAADGTPVTAVSGRQQNTHHPGGMTIMASPVAGFTDVTHPTKSVADGFIAAHTTPAKASPILHSTTTPSFIDAFAAVVRATVSQSEAARTTTNAADGIAEALGTPPKLQPRQDGTRKKKSNLNFP